MIAWITDPQILASLLTLTLLEIVLGIDNIVFISVLIDKLPDEQKDRARSIGILLALVFRILLLLLISAIIGLSAPVFSVFDQQFSWRDIILIAGGVFLLGKASHEIHFSIEFSDEEEKALNQGRQVASFRGAIVQIVIIDMVFSVDSIVTAIGIAEHVEVMIVAVIISMAVMYFASSAVSAFISKHASTKMLALSFLLLIGMTLVADGLGFHLPRGYIYAAMAFAVLVELFNILAIDKKRRALLALRKKDDVS
ncbi:MAG: TerC family protein [Cohaesibacteraceae bacterium]|nr:TerC family protein [Cohaesibacteraceae bacterium]